MEKRQSKNLGAGIAIGIGIGTALGVAIDNIGAGVGMGIALGVAIGMAMDEKNGGEANETISPETSRRILFVVLGLGAFAALALFGYTLFLR